MGRRTILNDSIRDQIERYLRAGVPVRWATEAAGISHVAHYDWIAKGEAAALISDETGNELSEDEEKYVEYANATRKALAEGRARPVLELVTLAFSGRRIGTGDNGEPIFVPVDDAVKARILQFLLTHGDREHWRTSTSSDVEKELEEVKVELEW